MGDISSRLKYRMYYNDKLMKYKVKKNRHVLE
jgi:hypothetical protein